MSLMADRPRTRPHDRTDTIHDMLSHYHEARCEAGGSGEAGGSRLEARMLGFDPTTFTREFRELERCLNALRYLAEHGRPMIERNVSSGAAWWNIRARYLEVEEVRRKVHLKKNHHGERHPVALPANCEIVSRPTSLNGSAIEILPERGSVSVAYMKVRTWDQRVDPQVVGAALRWISSEFRGTPRPYSVA